MRISNAALAVISRVATDVCTEYLAQWNHNWNVYSLIGGHVEAGETFRQACLREITEELECDTTGIELAPYPYATLRFSEYSRAAKQDTDYHWQVFVTRLPNTVLNNLPTDCQWITANLIRSGSAADGKPIADQAKRVLKAVDEAEFDLFVSYGHADNADGSVTALVEHIRREHKQFAPTEPLKIFFDLWGIQNSDDWKRRIYRGLIESKTMLAVLSPAYFASEWCQKEYNTFRQQHLKKLYPGEPVHAIYIQQHRDFEASETGDAHPLQDWFDGLKKQQFEDAKPWWPDGQQALQQAVVVGRLNELRLNIWKHVCDARAIQQSPSNLSGFNYADFVGRQRELTELWNTLRLDQVVAVFAIQGVGGLGKTALARAYAHTRRMDYLGGQFEIGMENVTTTDGLKLEIVRLANLYLGANIPDETTNTNLNAAFATAKACFERPGQGNILLILDNVAEEGVLSARTTCLPSPEFVHVLATTRLDPERWGLGSLRLESLSTKDALDLFQKYRPFQIPDDTERWNRILTNSESIPETEVDSDEWKAAVGIVNRLGGHALAIEVVAVYLGNHRSISLVDYQRGLIRKGLSVKLSQAGDDPAVKARLSAAIETNIGELLEPTFERLEQENPLAMRALEWAALMPPDHVPWIWLRDLLAQDHSDQLQHDPDDPDPWTDGVVSQLTGWRLLSCESEEPVARIHRILQTAIITRTQQTTSDDAPDAESQTTGVATSPRLLTYLNGRSTHVQKKWGRTGVNWVLLPLVEAAFHILPTGEAAVGLMISRLVGAIIDAGRASDGTLLLQRLISFEECVLQAAQPDANRIIDLAESYQQLGELQSVAEKPNESRTSFEKAISLLQHKSLTEVADHKVVLGAARADISLADCLHSAGETIQATDSLTRTISTLAQLRERETEERYTYPGVLHNLGAVLIKLGDLSAPSEIAFGYHQQGLRQFEELVYRWPEHLGFRSSCAAAHSRVAKYLWEVGRHWEAVAQVQRSHQLSKHASSVANEHRGFQVQYGVSHSKLGNMYQQLEESANAIRSHEKSVELLRSLHERYPDDSEIHYALFTSQWKLAECLQQIKGNDAALPQFMAAYKLLKSLLSRGAESVDLNLDLAHACNQLGHVFRSLKRYEESESFYTECVDTLSGLSVVTPNDLDHLRTMCSVITNLSGLFRIQGRFSESYAMSMRDIAIRERLVSMDPVAARDAYDFSVACERIANLYEMYGLSGEQAVALQWLRRGLEIVDSARWSQTDDSEELAQRCNELKQRLEKS